MNSYVLSVFAHIVASVVLVGYGLFWAVMAAAARREPVSDSERARLLDITRRARWPLSGGKLSLPAVGWLVLIGVVVTGALCFSARFSLDRLFDGGRANVVLIAKLVFVVVLAVCLPKVASTRVWPAFVSLAVALTTVVASVFLIR
jgi:uncharacterized membrane protein